MIRYLLLPLSWVYGLLAWLRNKAFDAGVFQSYQSPLLTVVVGNLQAGGAGKTPMTAYLYGLLSPVYKTAILSRGYGRRSSGLIEAGPGCSPESIGDEPYWYYTYLNQARVLVSERRAKGLRYLEQTDAALVLLDDAYQHRAVRCDVQLLLSEYARPYYTDYVLPAGRLREFRNGDRRADFIILSKCPENLSLQDKISAISQINPLDHQMVFFTGLKPSGPRPLKGNAGFETLAPRQLLALSGIASPASFTELCLRLAPDVRALSYGDHHAYTPADIAYILEQAEADRVILCTEKDAVKLSQPDLLNLIPENRIFVLPVKPYFLFEEEARFNAAVKAALLAAKSRKSGARFTKTNTL